MADLICDEVLTVEQETSEHLQTENEMSNMGKSIKVHLFREGCQFYLSSCNFWPASRSNPD